MNELIATNREIASLGRFAVTLRPVDIGRFKTPSLRNVAVTGPYMHDGSVRSLLDAVELELYSRRDGEHRPIVLSEMEVDDIVEFLKSLTSPVEEGAGPHDRHKTKAAANCTIAPDPQLGFGQVVAVSP
ncbi:MAG: hypothetical protein WB823_00570 [Steroidobacteraceae bacterium]